jgi:hypothetical protein
MKLIVIMSAVAMAFALPGADPLANPFALDGRSIGGKCDHSVSIEYKALCKQLKI